MTTVDPWKPCTPHSFYATPRADTILRPFKLIPGTFYSFSSAFTLVDCLVGCDILIDGVHHYDENGLRNPKDEPPHIQRIHREIVEFVKAWLEDWTPPKKD